MGMTVGDKSGNPVVLSHSSSDPCFSLGVNIPAAQFTAGVLLSFTGAAGFVTRIKWIRLVLRSGTAASTSQQVTLERRSTATTGGAVTAVTPGKHDSVNDTTAQQTTVTAYFNGTPVAPTPGTLVATLRSEPLPPLAATVADTTNSVLEWNFTTRGDKPPTLRGASDFMTLSLSASLGTAQNLQVQFEMEESTT